MKIAQKWEMLWNFWGEIDDFDNKIFQTAVPMWKSSTFVNFDMGLETIDSNAFLAMKITDVWPKFKNQKVGQFFRIFGINSQN